MQTFSLIGIIATLMLTLYSLNAGADVYTASNLQYSDSNGYSGTTTVGNFSGIEPGTYAGLGSPGQITWDVGTPAGDGSLSFEIAGYGSLDGESGTSTDTLTVYVNSVEYFSGAFELGGVFGYNEVIYNPGNASWNADQYGYFQGGVLDVGNLLVSNLLAGVNVVQFVYSGMNQGTNDEAWGLNSASLTVPASAVPLPSSLFMFMAGLSAIFSNFAYLRKALRRIG